MTSLHARVVSGTGSRIVFLHGVLRNGRCFGPLFPPLHPSWEIHSLDLRGHGSSPAGDRYRVFDYVADVIGYLRRGGTPVVLYGHSLGAMVAAKVAATVPSLTRAVVLEDPPFHTMGARLVGTPLHGYFSRIQPWVGSQLDTGSLARTLSNLDVPAADGVSSVKLGTLRDATSLRFFASCLRQVRPEVIEPIVAGTWLDGYDLDPAAIPCPVLLLQSDPANGGMLTDEDARWFASRASDCSPVLLRGIGHQAHWLGTGAVVRHLTEFLLSLESLA